MKCMNMINDHDKFWNSSSELIGDFFFPGKFQTMTIMFPPRQDIRNDYIRSTHTQGFVIDIE